MTDRPFILRPYQDEAVAAGLQSIERGRNGIVAAPTGSGKSLLIAEIAVRTDQHIVVLQPTREILEQNLRKLLLFGHRDVSVCSASMGAAGKGKVTFATIGTIISRMGAFRGTDLIIVDEAHLVNAKGGRYSEFIESIGAPVIGLTATPYRMHSAMAGGIVAAKFLNRTRPRLFDNIIHVTQNADLHRDGWLAPIEYQEAADYDPLKIALNSTGMNFRPEALERYNRAYGLVRKAADTVIGSLDRCRHILVFLSSVAESDELSLLLRAAGIEAAHIDGATPGGERADTLKAFQSGKVRVVCNVGVLTTGYDFPELDGIVLARPTMSLPLHYQMIGRGVRTAPGKGACRVFDLCGNVARFGRPDEYTIEKTGKRGTLHRLRSGRGKWLTGVNFIDGKDLENRPKRTTQANPNEPWDGVVTFGKHGPQLDQPGKHISDVPGGYLRWGVQALDSETWRRRFAEEMERRARELTEAKA